MTLLFTIFPLFGKGLLAGMCYALPIGPLASISLNKTLETGVKSGIASFLGIAFADLFYILIAAFGFSLVRNFINDYLQIIKYISYGVILLIGLSMLLTNYSEKTKCKTLKSSFSNTKSFLSLFFLGLTNPVALFVFINLIPILSVETELPFLTKMLVLSVSIVMGMMLYWTVLVYLVNYFRRLISIKKIIYFQKALGFLIVFIASASILFSVLNLSF